MNIAIAKAEANKIIEKALITKPNELSIEEITYFIKGPSIEYEQMNNCEGKFLSLGENSLIIINSNISNHGRRKFTIAHELGHYILHRNNRYIKCDFKDIHDWSSSKFIEVEANYFAAEILMPSDIFSKCSKKENFSLKFLSTLSEEFQTSLTSTAIKFAENGHDPIFVICSRNGEITWMKKSEGFDFWIDFKSLKKIPKYTLTHDFLTNDTLSEGAQQINPLDWHINPQYKSNNFFEEVYNLNSYGYTLTFISVRN